MKLQHRFPTALTALTAIAGFLALIATPSFGQSADDILQRVADLQESVKSESSTITLKIIDQKGRDRTRTMQLRSTIDEADKVKSIVIFSAPADIRGTGLLTVEGDKSDEQQLYLPAIKRVQRVAGSKRNERFVGSDFSYRDLSSSNPDRFTATMQDDQSDAWIIESTPIDNKSPYSRLVLRVDKRMNTQTEVRYYNKSGKHWKTLQASDFIEAKDGVWRANKLIMKDVLKNRRTELTYSDRTFGKAHDEAIFTVRQLEKGRF